MVTRIERTYHRRRMQAHLGSLTRIEYEANMTTTASQATRPTVSPIRSAVPYEVGES